MPSHKEKAEAAGSRLFFLYQSPMTRCITRLTEVMPTQQTAPISRAFPGLNQLDDVAVQTDGTYMAIMMKNLLSSFSGLKKAIEHRNGLRPW